MTDSQDRPFDPVIVDLTDPKDYAILLNALEEYAADMKGRAEDEEERIKFNNLPEGESDAAHWEAQAARAQRMIDDVERQLEANHKARRDAAEGV